MFGFGLMVWDGKGEVDLKPGDIESETEEEEDPLLLNSKANLIRSKEMEF